MRSSTLTYTFTSLIFLTTDAMRSGKHQVGEWPWNSVASFRILLFSTDRAAFSIYEQIIIHICPNLVCSSLTVTDQTAHAQKPVK